MTHPRLRVATAPVLAAMLALSACTPSASEPRIPSPPRTTMPSASTSPTPSPIPTASPTPISTPTPSPSPTPDPADEIAALWQDFTEAHLSRHKSPDVEVDLTRWLSRDIVPSQTIGLDLPTYPTPSTPRPNGEVQTYPRITVNGDTAELTDCMIYRVTGEGVEGREIDDPDNSRNWEATLRRNPRRGWIITDISAAEKTDTNCVPPQLRRQILKAYGEYVEAEEEWWNPPDPDHPALPDFVTQTHLTRLRDEIMPPQIEANAILRNVGTTEDAVVTDIGLSTASIEGCTQNDPRQGLFDADSGGRLDPPIDDDPATNRGYAANLVRGQDGRWRVDATGGWVNIECEIGEPL